MISADHLHRTPVGAARLVPRRPANGRRSAGIYRSSCGCQALPLDLPHARSSHGERVPSACERAARPRYLWWSSGQLRWPVALLALLPPRLVGRRLLRPVLHPRADGLEQAVDDGGGDRARPSDEGGGDDRVLQPDGQLDDSWTGDNKSRARVARPMPHPESDRGLLREALRPLPQADAVSWVAAPRVYQSGPTGLPNSCAPGMAPGTAWPPARRDC
jgi:hypothetical protein